MLVRIDFSEEPTVGISVDWSVCCAHDGEERPGQRRTVLAPGFTGPAL